MLRYADEKTDATSHPPPPTKRGGGVVGIFNLCFAGSVPRLNYHGFDCLDTTTRLFLFGRRQRQTNPLLNLAEENPSCRDTSLVRPLRLCGEGSELLIPPEFDDLIKPLLNGWC